MAREFVGPDRTFRFGGNRVTIRIELDQEELVRMARRAAENKNLKAKAGPCIVTVLDIVEGISTDTSSHVV
jgi:hypothetical protein